jgi:hypothetical protein
MQPGAPRVAKPSWLRIQPYVPTPPPMQAVVVPVQVVSSVPPPRSRPSVPPPSSRRIPPAQIQTTREVELESEVVALHNELSRVTAESETMKARVIEESEPEILSLALAIAKRVIARELATDPTLIRSWIAEARGVLPNAQVFVAADVALADGDTIDPSLPPGSAELRDGASAVAVGADARTAAIADALGVDA